MKDQHGIAVHRGVDRGHLLVGQRPPHVDPLDLARETRPELANGDRHGTASVQLLEDGC